MTITESRLFLHLCCKSLGFYDVLMSSKCNQGLQLLDSCQLQRMKANAVLFFQAQLLCCSALLYRLHRLTSVQLLHCVNTGRSYGNRVALRRFMIVWTDVAKILNWWSLLQATVLEKIYDDDGVLFRGSCYVFITWPTLQRLQMVTKTFHMRITMNFVVFHFWYASLKMRRNMRTNTNQAGSPYDDECLK